MRYEKALLQDDTTIPKGWRNVPPGSLSIKGLAAYTISTQAGVSARHQPGSLWLTLLSGIKYLLQPVLFGMYLLLYIPILLA